MKRDWRRDNDGERERMQDDSGWEERALVCCDGERTAMLEWRRDKKQREW